MRTDAIDSREFFASALDAVTQHKIQRRIRTLSPDVSSMQVPGLDFARLALASFSVKHRTPWLMELTCHLLMYQ